MKNIFRTILLLAVFTAVPAVKGFSFHYNFTIEEIPMQLFGIDKNASNFYSFFNILNAGASVNLSDDLGLKFRLKYSFFGMTNVNVIDPSNGTILTNNQHKVYVDRLSFFYNSDLVNILAGRDLFFENDGMLIGNLADGVNLNFNLFGFKEKIYAYYSGLLPKEVNQFSANLSDQTNVSGASRLSVGLVLQKFGILTKSISLMGLYSVDLTANKFMNPFYLALMSDGIIAIPRFSYNLTAALQLGNYSGTTNLFGWAGNLSLFYLLMDAPVKIMLVGEFAIASGNSTNTATTYTGFDSFGLFSTGYVLYPNFSNLMFFKLGAVFKLFDEHLDIKANYYYLTRLVGYDMVNGLYNGTNTQIGHEVSGSVNYEIDPNFSVFANAGFLVGNQSITNKPGIYKVSVGVALKI